MEIDGLDYLLRYLDKSSATSLFSTETFQYVHVYLHSRSLKIKNLILRYVHVHV